MSGKTTIYENMKKITILSALLFLFAVTLSAQNYEEGDMNLNAGIGIGSAMTGDLKLPPISASFEYGLAENIGVGVYFGYATAGEEYNLSNGNSYRWDYQYIVMGARGAYHFFAEDNFDAYGGLMLGFNLASASFSSDDIEERFVEEVDAGGFTYSLFAGARYYFNYRFGVFGELGYGVSFLNLGVTLGF